MHPSYVGVLWLLRVLQHAILMFAATRAMVNFDGQIICSFGA